MLRVIWDFQNRHFLILDWVIPSCVVAAVLAGVWGFAGESVIQDAIAGSRATAYGALAGVAASLLGFSITLIPLMHALLSIERLRALREHERTPDLFQAILHTAVVLGCLCALSLAAVIFERETNPITPLQCAVFFVAIVAAWKVRRAIFLLRLMTRVAVQSYQQPRTGAKLPLPRD